MSRSFAASSTSAPNVEYACVLRLADTLKSEYADALRRIEVEGVAVKDYADAAKSRRATRA
ncbi:MAG: hypothetical protein WDO69_09215 [Pseudomonadota bacterium]